MQLLRSQNRVFNMEAMVDACIYEGLIVVTFVDGATTYFLVEGSDTCDLNIPRSADIWPITQNEFEDMVSILTCDSLVLGVTDEVEDEPEEVQKEEVLEEKPKKA